MDKNKIIKLANEFYNLHKQNGMFILPNVWDAGSAVTFEKAGFKAIATTSAGIAYSFGMSDGENISLDDLISVVSRITDRIKIPLSVDFERGYGDTPNEVKQSAKKLINAGAVGFNIEDGLENGSLEDMSKQLQKIKALVELKKELNIPFVINARTCAFWLNVEKGEKLVELAIERCNRFKEEGADSVFVPGAIDEQTAKRLVNEIDIPLNLIANSNFNDFKRLNEIGVKRLSIGSGAVRAVYNELINISQDLKNGQIEKMTTHSFSYDKANKFFE